MNLVIPNIPTAKLQITAQKAKLFPVFPKFFS